MDFKQCGIVVLSILTASTAAHAAALQQAAQMQPALPATAPTQAVSASQLPSANPSVDRGTTRIEWDGHLLQVSADGASLRDVLQQIAARTGMRLVGSTPDDRIYGTYGPASLSDTVMDLVDGLSTNVLFADRSGNRPPELTFTSRVGGATPPATSTQQAREPYYPPQNAYQPPSQTQNQQGPPAGGPPNFGGNANGNGIAAGGNADTQTPSDSSGVPASPNGVKTPQEIFEQLQRLRATRPPQ